MRDKGPPSHRRPTTFSVTSCLVGILLSALPACTGLQPDAGRQERSEAQAAGAVLEAETSVQEEQSFDESRDAMIGELRRQGIESEEVLAAVGRVPRERFVPVGQRRFAYGNHPLPIGHGQTISQPFVVALMTELLQLQPGDKVLEIGTGSGYQAAILAELEAEVYTIEIIVELAESASSTLTDLGYRGVHVRHGDGYLGWPEEAPFDKVIVTAAPEEIPPALVEQLREGGEMVIPVGPQGSVQQLTLLEKVAGGATRTTKIIPVAFVPMVR